MADVFPEHKERQGTGWRERGHSTLLEALAGPGEQPDLFFPRVSPRTTLKNKIRSDTTMNKNIKA